jgi:hypothetical protein
MNFRRSTGLWIALGFAIAWVILGAIALHYIRRAPPPVNHCPPHEAGNPWCIR